MSERSERIPAARTPVSRTVMGSGGAAPEQAMSVDAPAAEARPKRGERGRYVFFPLALAGLVVSLVLGVHAVHNRPELKVSGARVRQDGLVATVQVIVTNRSDSTWCPVIQIAARKRNGADLAKLQGVPVSGTGKIAPRQPVGFKVTFTELTQNDYDRLDKFVGYVESQEEC